MLSIIILDKFHHEKSVKITQKSFSPLLDTFGGDFQELVTYDKTEAQIGAELLPVLQSLTSEYFLLVHAGDCLRIEKNTLIQLKKIYDEQSPITSLRYEYTSKPNETRKENLLPTGLYDINEVQAAAPLWYGGSIYPTEIFSSCTALLSSSDFQYYVLRFLENHPQVYFDPSLVLLSDSPSNMFYSCAEALSEEWYWGLTDHILSRYLSHSKETGYTIPDVLKQVLLQMIWVRYHANQNTLDKHVLQEDSLDLFNQKITAFLQCLSNADLIKYGVRFDAYRDMNQKDAVAYHIFDYTLHFSMYMLKLKVGKGYKTGIRPTNDGQRLEVYFEDISIMPLDRLKIRIDLLEYDQLRKQLIIEYHIDNAMELEAKDFPVEFQAGNIPYTTEETYRYSHTKYFSVSVERGLCFRTILDLSNKTKLPLNLQWIYKKDQYEIVLPIYSTQYCARLSNQIENAYYHIGPYVFSNFKRNQGIHFAKANPFNIAGHEITLMFSTLTQNQKQYTRAKIMRLLYLVTRPYFHNKHIWLTYDKLYKGGDCGEYLYKYMCTRAKETGITPAYVINGNAADCNRLIEEGYQPLKFSTIKHFLYYMNSEVVFTTHGGVWNFNCLTHKTIPYLQGFLKHDVACIQHGLTVQQLAHNSARLFNNMKRYYCASKYEIENLAHPIYGYEDKSILKLTGIPRYDGLVNQDKHQILITPTWRNYIAMPTARKNEAKPYSPTFKDTDYFKIYNALLKDEKLIETAKKTGYKLIYLLHPAVSSQYKDYPQSDEIEIIQATNVNYEKILTESSLMLTDYSGVQFDFAYMRKPVVYYHPDALPPHYKEGGFFYDTQGFGEICKEHNELVDILCGYMENECKLKPIYQERQDDFFAFSDLDSSKRIFEDMLEYQKNQGRIK